MYPYSLRLEEAPEEVMEATQLNRPSHHNPTPPHHNPSPPHRIPLPPHRDPTPPHRVPSRVPLPPHRDPSPPHHDRPPHNPPHQPSPPNRPGDGKPSGPPPHFIPERRPGGPGLLRVDPGAIRGCLNSFAYIWLDNGRAFWMYITFVGRRSVSGYSYTNFGWTYTGVDLNSIESFTCSRF